MKWEPSEYVSCNLCGRDSTRAWGKKHGMNIVQCRNCGLVYANPRLNSHQLDAYYSQTYFEDAQYDGDPQRARMYEIEIRQMLKIVGTAGRFLDVGCAYGRFLSCLPSTFEKQGVEFAAKAAEYAREKFGLDVHRGQLHEVPFEGESVDVVHFRGVFEHLQDPQRDLQVAHSILKFGGWLILSTVPNIAGPCGRLFKTRFKLVYPQEHIYYFSYRTLRRYCEGNGFVVKHVFYPYLGTPYENVVADSLAFVANYLTGRESPPFFGSVITVYAQKTRQRQPVQ
ncbi:MAG: class I SAM-dependent methyltransferase [Deltaproteobacteria bacterium]|nr:class I SAM-dependent methyltransferase [Deltaproteobacteria bacterium]